MELPEELMRVIYLIVDKDDKPIQIVFDEDLAEHICDGNPEADGYYEFMRNF